MKRFNFRLQRIFDYREALKLEQQRELARKAHELAMAEERLNDIYQAQQEAPITPGGMTTMAELGMLHDYMQGLAQMYEEQTVVVQFKELAVDEARVVYTQRAVESKTLATVRERRLEEYNDEKRGHEKSDIDDLTVQRYRFRDGE